MGTDNGGTTLVLPDGTEITVREGDGVPYDLCECEYEIAGAVAQAVPPDTGDHAGTAVGTAAIPLVIAALAAIALTDSSGRRRRRSGKR